MKNFLNFLSDLIDTIGRARAASSLASMYRYQEAAEKIQSK